jgi:prepilin-type N-terminal cleavage/methylation domain-containing protein
MRSHRDKETERRRDGVDFPRTSSLRLSVSPSLRAAFTLTEVLIVIALIVLILALALPAFNFISGSRSVDGAQNTLSAFLGRARGEAIGLQEIRGVMFFIDPRTQRVNLAIVHETPRETTDKSAPGVTQVVPLVYLDTVGDREFLPMPKGVTCQTIENATLNPVVKPLPPAVQVRTSDGYVGFNRKVNLLKDGAGSQVEAAIQIGGVVLFDGEGRLISIPYGFRCMVTDPAISAKKVTAMGELLWGIAKDTQGGAELDCAAPKWQSTAAVTPYDGPLYSSLGLVMFEDEAFRNVGYKDDDPRVDTTEGYATGTPAERDEEKWIDDNATPFYINRYNGTLVKGE